MKYVSAIFIGILWAACASAACAESRVALVIGNSAYEFESPLKNAKNDAVSVAQMFEQIGFEVVGGFDLDYNEMRSAIAKFSELSSGSDLTVFYYSGHGFQMNGENYIVPTDAKIKSIADVDLQTIPLDLILKQVEYSGVSSLVFIDACRENPFEGVIAASKTEGASRSILGGGLANVSASGGTLIGFAAAPGAVAFDGTGPTGPYAAALIAHLPTPGLEINEALTRVRAEVFQSTDQRQMPWTMSSLLQNVYLSGKTAAEIVQPELAPLDAKAAFASVQTPPVSYDAARAIYEKGDMTLALAGFHSAAAEGDFRAEYYLGRMFARGEGVAQSSADAKYWYRAAAEQGHLLAQSRLAEMYLDGIGGEKGPIELALASHQDDGWSTAFSLYSIGVMFRDGKDIAKDDLEAASWFRMAAASGSKMAQLDLGPIYAKGLGVEQSYETAAIWTRKAAENGLAGAQYNLAEMLSKGTGVPPDPLEALAWLITASAQGYEAAKPYSKNLQSKLTAEQISEATRLAAEWQANAKSQD